MNPFRLPQTSRAAGYLLLAGTLLATACKKNNDPAQPQGPATVTFTQAGLYPEGVEYDATNGRFLVSSVTRGAIGQVADDGTYSVFADAPQLIGTAGLQLDAGHNRLLVAVGDLGGTPRSTPATTGQLAALATFEATTGKFVSYVNLSGLRPNQGHLANDVTFDDQGNYYVTDSFSPIIYKVDAQGVASVFLEVPALATPVGQFGFNGIAYHPDGYLLVGHTAKGTIYKVPLANPAAYVAVTTSANLAGDDGILLQDNQHLLVVSSSQNNVVRLTSTDGWGTATGDGSFATGANNFPTSIARRSDSETYVIYSHLDVLLSGQPTPAPQFSIVKVNLP